MSGNCSVKAEFPDRSGRTGSIGLISALHLASPMSHPVFSRSTMRPDADLEAALSAVELGLAALGDALLARDSAGIDRQASELHRALATAVSSFAHAARHGALPPALRLRLAHASGKVAAQRESLARATAALDRAIDVLMPSEAGAIYATHGGAERSILGGAIQA